VNSSNFLNLLNSSTRPHTLAEKKKHYDSACAAAGQFEMMNLYSALFSQCDIAASQVLVTQTDFSDPQRLETLKYTVERLLSLGIVPIINENDAVSGNTGYTADDVFSDNDSLAAICARNFEAEVLLLLTDVDGVYDQPPSNPGAKLVELYLEEKSTVEIGAKSSQGRGGMGSKIDAAMNAVALGSACSACVVASGNDLNSIRAVLGPDPKYGTKGTLFCSPGSALEMQALKEITQSEVRIKRKEGIVPAGVEPQHFFSLTNRLLT
jgi:delta-1-pyrroline-5-carboxylate synthetase